MTYNQSVQSKKFLLPILSLVVLSIVLVASVITYFNISTFSKHIENNIENTKQEFLKKQKDIISKRVHLVDDSIKFQIARIENKIKKSLKERIETALNLAQYIYDTHKDKYTKEELKVKISLYLNSLRFNKNNGYYFIYDTTTNIMLGHAIKSLIGKDMTNFKDLRGVNLVKDNQRAIKNSKIGFSKIYFKKPNDPNTQYPKIICVTEFKPLNLLIGTGEYLDDVEKQTKSYVINRFLTMQRDKNHYLFFLDLHNINGGDNFATMILNPNRPDLIGKKINDSYKDKKGKEFRKEFLENLRKDGKSYTKYWYKKPDTKEIKAKMSYFYLQKDWNWIIASGFYFEDLNIQIEKMENMMQSYIKNTIYNSIIWAIILSLIVILIAIYISIKIDTTIRNYADEIIEYKENQRAQDKIILEQSKMAQMGEMIGNIAHQWRQPLSVISTGATGMQMQKKYGVLTDEQFNTSCNTINDNAQYLSKTIDDFRNFIKGDRTKKMFNLQDGINSFLSLVKGTIKTNHINIILNLQEDIKIDGYDNELIQCLINIFNNAKDILKEIENEDNRLIFIYTFKEDKNVIIKIKDSAGGIPEDILSKIFEPYFTTKHAAQGTGLGLHMTYNLIVNGMNGTIDANNKTYKYNDKEYTGAEFKISLPIN